MLEYCVVQVCSDKAGNGKSSAWELLVTDHNFCLSRMLAGHGWGLYEPVRGCRLKLWTMGTLCKVIEILILLSLPVVCKSSMYIGNEYKVDKLLLLFL